MFANQLSRGAIQQFNNAKTKEEEPVEPIFQV